MAPRFVCREPICCRRLADRRFGASCTLLERSAVRRAARPRCRAADAAQSPDTFYLHDSPNDFNRARGRAAHNLNCLGCASRLPPVRRVPAVLQAELCVVDLILASSVAHGGRREAAANCQHQDQAWQEAHPATSHKRRLRESYTNSGSR